MIDPTFQFTWEMVDKSECESAERCVIANAFVDPLPPGYTTYVNDDGDGWFVEVYNVRDRDDFIRIMLPIDLANLARRFDRLGVHQKGLFWGKIKGRTFEYPQEFIDYANKAIEKENLRW